MKKGAAVAEPDEAKSGNVEIENTVAPENNMVYNKESIGRSGLNEGRENGDSGNKWFSKKIPGEPDTESNRAYGEVEKGGFGEGSSKRIRGTSMDSQDSEGKRINTTDAKKLKDTSIKDEKGNPIAVYHYTPEMEFVDFTISKDIGFHFGNQEQVINHKKARAEGKETGRTFRAYLNIKNPLRFSSDIMGWKAHGTALRLWTEGYLTDAELKEIQNLDVDGYDSPAAVRLREMLIEKGYDGIVYPNGFEGEGDSYIAFSNDQIIKTEARNEATGEIVQLNKVEEAVDAGDASTASSASSGKSKQYSMKKGVAVAEPDEGDSATEPEKSESDEEAFRRAFGDWAYDPEEESYFEETGLADDEADIRYAADNKLDALFEDYAEREKIIKEETEEQEKRRVEETYSSAISDPATEKKKLPTKLKESAEYLHRKVTNSGEAIRKIAKATKDNFLYPIYNRARGATNIVNDMLENKQTNIRGEKVGESLEAILSPIKDKGKEYFRDFHLYLLSKHNVARMSLENTRATAEAKMELDKFIKQNPEVMKYTVLGEDSIREAATRGDVIGFKMRQYLDLLENWRKLNKTRNKPIFFDREETPLSADLSRTKAEELLKKHPEFKEYEAKVRKFIDNVMQYRVDSGLITQEEADYFKKKYPDYIPTYRNTESNLQQLYRKTNIGKTMGVARGSNLKLLPLDIALAEMTKKAVRNGQKNILANRLLDLYDKDHKLFEDYITEVNEGVRDLDEQIDEFGEEDRKFKNSVSFYRDGKLIEMTVTPKLYEAFEEMSKIPDERAPVADWVRKVNDVYKKLITSYDPTFIVRNGIKDLQDAIINSRDMAALLKNLLKAYAEIAKDGEMFELYKSLGGLHSSRFYEIQKKGIEKGGNRKYIEDKIYPDMSDRERAKISKKTDIDIVEYNNEQDKFSKETAAELERTYKSHAQKVLKALAEKFGVFKDYSNSKIELEFNYSNRSLDESTHIQNMRNPNFSDFAKMLAVFDDVVANAQPIEAHSDKYAETVRADEEIKSVHVLLGAFKDGKDIIPVEFNIKEFKTGKANKLYVSVTLKRIEADLMAATAGQKDLKNTAKSASKYNIAEIIKNVNPADGDFLRYVPDELLSGEQKTSKRKSLEKDSEKISRLREKREAKNYVTASSESEANVNVFYGRADKGCQYVFFCREGFCHSGKRESESDEEVFRNSQTIKALFCLTI